VLGHDGGDELLVALDLRAQQVELADEEEGELAAWRDQSLVGGDRDGCGGCGDALLDDGFAVALVGIVEGAQLRGGRGLERLEVGELGQEAAGERGAEPLSGEIESLGLPPNLKRSDTAEPDAGGIIVDFQCRGEPVGGLGDLVDEHAAVLEVAAQLADLRGGRAPRGELAVSLEEEAGDASGIFLVVLGTGGVEGLAVSLDEEGIDEEQVDEVELSEEAGDVGAGLLDADGDLSVGVGRAQGVDPLEEGPGPGRDLGEVGGAALRIDAGDVELGVGPVDADEEPVGGVGGVHVGCWLGVRMSCVPRGA